MDKLWPTPMAQEGPGGQVMKLTDAVDINIGRKPKYHKPKIKISKKESQQLTFSPEVFHASRSVLPGSKKARKMTVSSGTRCYELSKNQIRLGSLAKMLLGSSVWNSTIVLLNWKMKGTKSKRLLYQLVPLTPDTDEIESGLWHTPNAMDGQAGAIMPKEVEVQKSGITRKLDNKGNSRGLGLARQFQMMPTPATRDYKGARKPETLEATGRNPMTNSLGDAINEGGQSGQLNPQFVSWLMGYPMDWCDIEGE